MAISEPTSLAVSDEMRTLARQLDAATHKEKGMLIAAAVEKFGWSRSKVYKQLESVGWSSGRKMRTDCGATKQSMDSLHAISATLKIGVRENGKATMHTPNAVSMLSQNGFKVSVSNSRINTLMRQRNLHLGAQRKDRAALSMQSLHPNHVHQVDPSLCLVYYMPDGKQRIMEDSEFYKNKLENLAKVKFKCWRYVLTDHYSASIVVRYYAARGETQANLYDFLLYAWNKKSNTLIHGVPQILLWDKGSANTSAAIKNALRALQVRNIEHKAKKARVKGSVENGNNLVETLFESRLRYEPVENVDQLNIASEAWYNAYNSNSIPNYDSRLHRAMMDEPQARYALWQRIRKDQLRILPDTDLCRMLLSGTDVARDVSQKLQISFKHPMTKTRLHYDVSEVPGIFVGQSIMVSPLVYGDAQVIITFENYKGEQTSQILKPIEVDGFSGFALAAPVIGEEFRSQPDTISETAGKAAQSVAYPGKNQEEIETAKRKGETPFGGLDAHSHLQHVSGPAFMDRPGQMLNVPDRLHVEVRPLSIIETKMRLRTLLGQPVTAEQSDQLRKWYPDGVLEDQLQEVIAALKNGSLETQEEAPRLVAVK